MLCVSKLQLSGRESILDNSSQIDQLVTEKSELQSKAEQVRFSKCSVKSNSEIFELIGKKPKHLSSHEKDNLDTD